MFVVWVLLVGWCSLLAFVCRSLLLSCVIVGCRSLMMLLVVGDVCCLMTLLFVSCCLFVFCVARCIVSSLVFVVVVFAYCCVLVLRLDLAGVVVVVVLD